MIKRKTKSLCGFERIMENKLYENSAAKAFHPSGFGANGGNSNSNSNSNTNNANNANSNNPNNGSSNSQSSFSLKFHMLAKLNDEPREGGYHSSRLNYNNNLLNQRGSNLGSNLGNNIKIEFAKALANNNNNNTKLSEKEEESSTNTQETILEKPKNFLETSVNITDENRNSIIFQPNSNNNRADTNESLNALNESNENKMRRSVNDTVNTVNTVTNANNNPNNNHYGNPLANSVNSLNSISSINSLRNSSKLSYNPFLVLKSHFDAVREIYLSPDKKNLVSVGEDMLINFWDFKKVIKHSKETNIEPYLTVRSHNTPVFTLTGPEKSESHLNSNSLNLYTSGMDGVIRPTKLPSQIMDKYQPVDEVLSEVNVNQPWRAHQDMIWNLNYHHTENFMSSVSSDGTVKIFRGYEDSNYYSYDSRSKNLIRQFTFKNNNYNFIEIPTCSFWSPKEYNQLYVSHIAPYVRLYDIETGKSVCDYSYNVEKNIPFECQQANKIICSDGPGLVITGHEDRQLRFFDPNQGKVVKSMAAHTDSVSALSVGLKEYEFFSGSHDGSIRCWDLRIFKLIFDIPAHRKKFDEGCLSIKSYPNEKIVLTAGADGLVKGFQFGAS